MEHSSTVRFSLDQFTKRKYNRYMYKVISKIGLTLNVCPTLDEAMAFAKTVGMFVTIKGPDFEVCGVFGVDTVRNGFCPDGVAYDWNKASRIGRVKKERV
jgi:hypothetical protein